jgi:3-dehydroquinate synthase
VSTPRVVRVDLPEGSYDITIAPDLLRDAGSILRSHTKSMRAAIVTNAIINKLHADTLQQALRDAGFDPITAVIGDGETHKSLEGFGQICDTLLEARIERSTPLLALGGGIVGDMGGFAAATLLRGLPFFQLPTSLLAMVDASVGGKTGINHRTGKNLIGAFHQPKAVLIDIATLATLPPRELRSGLAECIKHEIIRDAEGFAALEKSIDRALALDLAYLAELVAHNVQIKARVVQADPFEHGERAHLNFGHTFGHAIETISNYRHTHGECVALGMCAAAFAARKLKLIDESSRQRIVNLITRAELPTGGMGCDIDQVMCAMHSDKKVRSGRIRFILPDRIGNVIIRDDVPESLVRESLASIA